MSAISHSTTQCYSAVLATLFTLLCATIGFHAWRGFSPKNAPRMIREGYPFLGMLRFFSRRSDFYHRGIAESKTGNFSFHLGSHQIIALSGPAGRKLFYESRDLSVYDGVVVFFPTIPRIRTTAESDTCDALDPRWASKQVVAMMRSEYLNHNLPLLIEDAFRQLKSLTTTTPGQPRTFDPFEEIYALIYLLTMRVFGASDIADSPALLYQTRTLFEKIEASSSPARIIFPWLPTPAHFRSEAAAKSLYLMFKNIIQERSAAETRKDDALQYLLDQGSNVHTLISFILETLFGGLFNSGLNAAWMLVYLACNKEWYDIVQSEVDKAVAIHRTSPEQAPEEILATLTLLQWETEFPMLDLCLRECIRLQLLGTGFRKNVSGRDIPLGNTSEVIPAEAFVVYLIDEAHMNSDIYTDPEHWDPGRYLASRAEDKRQPLAWLGWGMGRNPCLGMRFAKLENTIITAFFVGMFDYHLIDLKNRKVETAPQVNRNNHAASRPDVPVRLHCSLRGSD